MQKFIHSFPQDIIDYLVFAKNALLSSQFCDSKNGVVIDYLNNELANFN